MSNKYTEADWYQCGKSDTLIGNTEPALTLEDFCRDIEDTEEAKAAHAAYMAGFVAGS